MNSEEANQSQPNPLGVGLLAQSHCRASVPEKQEAEEATLPRFAAYRPQSHGCTPGFLDLKDANQA